jgi:hypothetical protein
MLTRFKTDIKDNIFKQDIVDPNCCLLNKWRGTLGTCFYERDWYNNNIVKYYKNKDDFACEIILNEYLLKKKITTDFDIDIKNQTLSYILDDNICLYNYLENCNNYSTLRVLTNELFAFVNNFKKYHFIHGNLHIYNIFINPKTLKLRIIDFTHTRLIQKHNYINDEDLYSLYKSLHNYFTQKDDQKSISYLQLVALTYIAI